MQDFQAELKLQESDTKDAARPSRSETGSSRADSQKESQKKDSQKKDSQIDDLNLAAAAAVPLPVADPQKPVPPVEPDLSIPQEGAPSEQSNQTQPAVEQAQTPEDKNSGDAGASALSAPAAELPAQVPTATVAPPSPPAPNVGTPRDIRSQHPAPAKPIDDRKPIQLPARLQSQWSDRPQQLGKNTPIKQAAKTVAPDAQPAPENADLPIPALSPAEAALTQSRNSQPSANEAPAPEQPASQVDLKLPAVPPDPAASAVRETLDPAPAPAPAAVLAFAARMSPAPQKPSNTDSTPAPRLAPSLPFERIPIRYTPAAQIIQTAEDSDPEMGRISRLPETRADLAFSHFESEHQASPVSDPAPAPESVPTARAERVIEPAAAPPASAHDIRVRVPDNNGGATQVRFVETGGEVKVSVRADDPTLAQTLRTHLNDLSQRLADGGIPAEIWKPGSAAASQESSHQNPDREGRGSQGQQSGAHGGQQQNRDDRRPAWLEELEASLDAQA